MTLRERQEREYVEEIVYGTLHRAKIWGVPEDELRAFLEIEIEENDALYFRNIFANSITDAWNALFEYEAACQKYYART